MNLYTLSAQNPLAFKLGCIAQTCLHETAHLFFGAVYKMEFQGCPSNAILLPCLQLLEDIF